MMKSDMDKDLNELEEDNKYSQMNEEEMIKRIKWFEKKYGPYIEKKGFHNWRNLFRLPNMYEWTIFIMIVFSLFMAWAYTHDISECKEALNNLDVICMNYYESQIDNGSQQEVNVTGLNLSEIIFKADNLSYAEG